MFLLYKNDLIPPFKSALNVAFIKADDSIFVSAFSDYFTTIFYTRILFVDLKLSIFFDSSKDEINGFKVIEFVPFFIFGAWSFLSS